MSQTSYFSFFRSLLADAWRARLLQWGHPDLEELIAVERPAARQHGDLAVNLALMAAKTVGRPPRELAAELIDDSGSNAALAAHIASAEIAGPGFINFTLADAAIFSGTGKALDAGRDFGMAEGFGSQDRAASVLLEFVSANPTGMLHVGHARYAAYGDSLRRILEFGGHKVTTEFYVNDYGSQMDIFARSLAARYAQELGSHVDFPEDGYQGEYPVFLAKRIIEQEGDRWLGSAAPQPSSETLDFFRERGKELVLAEMDRQLDNFGVTFDNWFSEKSLYESGAVDRAIEELEAAGEISRREGALWLLTTRYGDDKDRVLIRGSGEPTYFASDIAYHRDKLARGFDRLINIWGADHHGYVPRMKAAFEALAHNPERLEIVIGQLVNVLELGERKQMSKRAGSMVSLEELIESIGVDAARFFLVDRSHDSTLDLDIARAKLKSEENPVYYVQYAHARICSILSRALEEGIGEPEQVPQESGEGADITDGALGRATLAPAEKDLALKLFEFPLAAAAAASGRSPQRITAYARELAATFHVFYHNCPVLKAGAENAAFRLDLCRLTRTVIARSLELVGVRAPESM